MMTLKEYLELKIKEYKSIWKGFDTTSEEKVKMYEGFLSELENTKMYSDGKWTPKLGEYCWFLEDTFEDSILHFARVIKYWIRTSNGRYGLIEEEVYRVLTSTEEVHETTLDNLYKFEGELPPPARK